MQNQIFYPFFWRLIDGYFEDGPIHVTWCDTSHVCKAERSVTLRSESNNFVPAVQQLPKFTSEKKKPFGDEARSVS